MPRRSAARSNHVNAGLEPLALREGDWSGMAKRWTEDDKTKAVETAEQVKKAMAELAEDGSVTLI